MLPFWTGLSGGGATCWTCWSGWTVEVRRLLLVTPGSGLDGRWRGVASPVRLLEPRRGGAASRPRLWSPTRRAAGRRRFVSPVFAVRSHDPGFGGPGGFVDRPLASESVMER